MRTPRRDIKGQRFGMLVASEYVQCSEKNKERLGRWKCVCDCGGVIYRSSYYLTSGETHHCGCQHWSTRPNPNCSLDGEHVDSHSTEYRVWAYMIQRCSNPRNDGFKNYGGRGISVCVRWKEFSNFLLDMGRRPVGKTLDRIDNNGNYCKENCRWSTASEQSRNTRRNVFISHGGTRLCIEDWATKLGLSPNSVKRRVANWGVLEALSRPKLKSRHDRRKELKNDKPS